MTPSARRTTKTKVPQVATKDLLALVSIARDRGAATNQAIACYIISVSPYWRSEGYANITQALSKIIEGETI